LKIVKLYAIHDANYNFVISYSSFFFHAWTHDAYIYQSFIKHKTINEIGR
jgi:putative heme iron utilization protein